jgi:hypothetical protein
MRSGFDKRLESLEQAARATRQTGQTIERYAGIDEDGNEVELVQQYCNGKPFGRPWRAWMWDAWDNAAEVTA